MDLESIVTILAEQGILGALVVTLGYTTYKKDQQVKELNRLWREDRDQMSERVYTIAEKLTQIERLTDLVKQMVREQGRSDV